MTRDTKHARWWVAFVAIAAGPSVHAQTSDWVQIPLNGPVAYALPDGSIRTLNPSCSNGPTRSDAGDITPADPQYSFLLQPGNPRQLVIMLDGGGACWDALTCLGSPLLGASSYTQSVDETPADADQAGGILDRDNPANPYLQYTKVFIPYCSGDVHWGSRDTPYSLHLPGLPRLDDWVIRHRGTDNFLAVLQWLRTTGSQYLDLAQVRNVTVAGASAGAYGAAVAFPYVAELVPHARLHVIADAGIGVIDERFYKTAIYDPAQPDAAHWGVVDSLPTFMGLDESFLAAFAEQPLDLVPAWFAELARYKPRARLAMLTSNLDTTQIGFYTVMELEAGAPLDPAALALGWYLKMQGITNATEGLRNYRSFIEGGTYHTIVASERYYEAGQSGVSVRDWNAAMITPGTEGWDNIDVGSPF